jgi:SAM-dependent methyltransferase
MEKILKSQDKPKKITTEEVISHFDKTAQTSADEARSRPAYINFTSNELFTDVINTIKSFSGNILDIGCGTGTLELQLVKKGEKIDDACRIVGIDLSEKSLARAAELKIDKVNYIHASALTLPFKSESFQTVLMIEAIEHLTDQKKALQEVHRVLRKNGQFILTTPNGRDCLILRAHNFLLKLTLWLRGHKFPHKDDYLSARKLLSLLGETGFIVVEPSVYRYFYPLALTIRNSTFGIIPPATPGLLIVFTKILRRLEKNLYFPRSLQTHLFWRITVNAKKQDAAPL